MLCARVCYIGKAYLHIVVRAVQKDSIIISFGIIEKERKSGIGFCMDL